jgi:outer membrane protein assembly factor BamB
MSRHWPKGSPPQRTDERLAGQTAALSEIPATAVSFPSDQAINQNHNAFRGPFGNPVSQHKNLPTEWDGAQGKNILWKTAVPLHAFNSPVLWGDKLFIAGADTERREIFCYNRHTGNLLWRRPVVNIPGSPAVPPKTTEDTGLAAPSLTTDGIAVYAIFGTGDIIAFDMEGNRKWARNLGVPDNHYGHSSSLLSYREKLFVQFDDRKSGRIFA